MGVCMCLPLVFIPPPGFSPSAETWTRRRTRRLGSLDKQKEEKKKSQKKKKKQQQQQQQQQKKK